jgi:superfamily II DNA or RNA helicase
MQLLKLLHLLNPSATPSSAAARQLVYEQLAALVEADPSNLPLALSRLHGLLHHPSLATRLSAASALRVICSTESVSSTPLVALDEKDIYSLASFDLNALLAKGEPLLRCPESGIVDLDDVSDEDWEARIQKQRDIVRQTIGVKSREDLAFLDDSDFVIRKVKRSKSESTVVNSDGNAESITHINTVQELCIALKQELFSMHWEIRHGAAIAWLELLQSPIKVSLASLEDLAVRLLCVCALDRFADYSTGAMKAPVREVASQMYALLVKQAPLRLAEQSVLAMVALMDGSFTLTAPDVQLQIAHGATLSVAYIFQVVPAALAMLPRPRLIALIIAGLSHGAEDVRAAAAQVARVANEVEVPTVHAALWSALVEDEGLPTSVAPLLQALAACSSTQLRASLLSQSAATQASFFPRFLTHVSPLVRRAALSFMLAVGYRREEIEEIAPHKNNAPHEQHQHQHQERERERLLPSNDALAVLLRRCGEEEQPALQALAQCVWAQLAIQPQLPSIDASLWQVAQDCYAKGQLQPLQALAVLLVRCACPLTGSPVSCALSLPPVVEVWLWEACSEALLLLPAEEKEKEKCAGDTNTNASSSFLSDWQVQLGVRALTLLSEAGSAPANATPAQLMTLGRHKLGCICILVHSGQTSRVASFNVLLQPLLKGCIEPSGVFRSKAANALAKLLPSIPLLQRRKVCEICWKDVRSREVLIQRARSVPSWPQTDCLGGWEAVQWEKCLQGDVGGIEVVACLLGEGMAEWNQTLRQQLLNMLLQRLRDGEDALAQTALLPDRLLTLCATVMQCPDPWPRHLFTQVAEQCAQKSQDFLAERPLPFRGLERMLAVGDIRCLPLLPHVLVPVVRGMSHASAVVRTSAASCFSHLLQLIPLGVAQPSKLDSTLIQIKTETELEAEVEANTETETAAQIKIEPSIGSSREDDLGYPVQKEEGTRFLKRLMGGEPLPLVDCTQAQVTLRSYQAEGVAWLVFLRRHGLHGILADDMGLGKTLQTLCLIASDEMEEPALVVCPSSLVGHWAQEALKYFDPKVLEVIPVFGSPGRRRSLWCARSLKRAVYVISYANCRADIEFCRQERWSLLVMDEAHVLKNSESKTTKAIARINAVSRVALTGTPIQNDVLDMWSLFNLLMPGLLGDSKRFRQLYSEPIARGGFEDATEDEQEQSRQARDRLHRQVLPFILRRTKDQVLKELPPKIISDEIVEMAPVQQQLYSAYSQYLEKNRDMPQEHVFKSMHILKLICSHPLLAMHALPPAVLEETNIEKELTKPGRDLAQDSSKLLGLRDILQDSVLSYAAYSPERHRLLVFAQNRKLLDLVETHVLRPWETQLRWVRLDGSVPAEKRAAVAEAFNVDLTQDVMLLTTKVGGLGLNLTGADTVVFLEHDWNPTQDLQAMDRAHRLGQEKTVNVFRIVSANSLEETVLSVQRFKRLVADTVVSSENSDLRAMDGSSLMDLIAPATIQRNAEQMASTQWEDANYHDLDLDNFVEGLH